MIVRSQRKTFEVKPELIQLFIKLNEGCCEVREDQLKKQEQSEKAGNKNSSKSTKLVLKWKFSISD